MKIINTDELHRFAKRHPAARSPLDYWLDITTKATWKNFFEIRNTFRSADRVKDVIIFDIGGNKFRLIASIDYNEQKVYILEIMMHAEYDRWKK